MIKNDNDENKYENDKMLKILNDWLSNRRSFDKEVEKAALRYNQIGAKNKKI